MAEPLYHTKNLYCFAQELNYTCTCFNERASLVSDVMISLSLSVACRACGCQAVGVDTCQCFMAEIP